MGFFSFLFSGEHVCCLNITTRIWVAGTTKWQTRSPPKQHGKLHRNGNDRDSLFYHGELSVLAIPSMWISIVCITELDDGKIYRKPLYSMVKTLVSGWDFPLNQSIVCTRSSTFWASHSWPRPFKAHKAPRHKGFPWLMDCSISLQWMIELKLGSEWLSSGAYTNR